ncbi:thioredoxin family protein [uncultured Muribaculum sp.]|uniref:thioredoxin family protein n=1 Tax=uncultured Muribaculum sp. TaxID=1918613 RepID=UPI00264A25D8|nr:thioredoxin family protein [uncultured Muribaculum sp.]
MNELTKALGEAKPTLVGLYKPSKESSDGVPAVVDQLRSQLGDKANVLAVDGSQNEDLIKEYKVASYPCWLLFKDGAVAWRDYGCKHAGELEHIVREFI